MSILPEKQRIITLRRYAHGWTQAQLALRAGCSKRTIEYVEAGKPVTERTLRRIAKALEVTWDTLRVVPQE